VGVIEVAEVDDPTCGPFEVMIAVANCGVCGTDRSIFRGEYPVVTPMILGHEYSGTVVEIGPGVTRFALGDRVAVDPNVVDDDCFFCRRGESHLCSGLSALGVGRSGGFAELSVVPERYLYQVPDSVSLADAALVEPLACCVRGIDQAQVCAGDVVVICGAGPIGCLLIQLARLSGAAVIVVSEPSTSRHEAARRAGADVVCEPAHAPGILREIRGAVGADVVIEASGSLAAAESSFDLVRRGGTILLFAVYPQDRTIAVSPFRINEDELRVVGSLNNPSTHSRALELLASGRVNVEGMVSHRLGLEEVASAMDLANFSDSGKIVIDLGESR
jgi:2-desacetyl-2-hydroxyethyl bacteriochlorophyllide A dehydrogenase